MKMVPLRKTGLLVPAVAVGCMRFSEMSPAEMNRFIHEALSCGANFFDHADIYGGGKSESIFGEACKGDGSIRREDLLLQSKCSICPDCYDSSKTHILQAVDGILQRLHTDYLDVLLLHRPDALMEPEEVAEAFRLLKKEGKLRSFGVSTHNPMQIKLLNSCLDEPVCVNQIQFSIAHCPAIDAGFNVNIHNDAGCVREGGVIEYCRLHKIRLQAWSPFQHGMFEGVFIGNEKFTALNAVIDRLADKYGVTANAVATAWILRHPAGIQTIVGSVNLVRVKDICKASGVDLTREEWYELYLAAGKQLP